MKRKLFALGIACVLVFSVGTTGCKKSDNEGKKVTSESAKKSNVNIVKRVYKEFKEDEMGLWECDGFTYQYKKELTGVSPDTDEEITFVTLTNDDSVTFEKVYKSMYSSSAEDRLDDSMTLVVEIK
ncbi:MAG: hypothetical protein E7254_02770 [Lachnospiraceae bacterium]|nr:hypothetical protein [Lachnospiraceae bacterium]